MSDVAVAARRARVCLGEAGRDRVGFVDDRVLEDADALDLDADRIPGPEPDGRRASHAHACWCARRDDVARLEGERRGQVLDHLPTVEHQIRGRAVLAEVIVDPRPDAPPVGIADLVGGDEPRPDRTVAVPRLAHRHGGAPSLPVAHAHVVHDQVAGDHRSRPVGGDVPAAPADDHAELALVVDLLRGPGDLDGRPRAHDARRLLVEPQLVLGQVASGLGHMIPVVQADGEELRWSGDGRQQPEVTERDAGPFGGQAGDARTGEESQEPARQRGVGGGHVDDLLVIAHHPDVPAVIGSEGDDSHGVDHSLLRTSARAMPAAVATFKDPTLPTRGR
ncbi:MAG: hypothetical protein NVSMB12_01710 [Acidimicrobiales bacterium]